MASLWRKSQEVIRDNNDARATGARAYFFVAGTTTPLTTFKDNALTTPHAHPVIADAGGRMPAVFFTVDGTHYKERIETGAGSLLWEVDHIDAAPAVLESEPGAVVSVDLLDCGDVIWRPTTGTRAGWVRLNGRTIGPATSSASERANADTEDLFTLLWNADNAGSPLLTVSGGRGASAAADWAAGTKTISLPDLRGRTPFGLDDMGNTAANRLPGTLFAGNNFPTKLFSAAGAATHALSISEMPSHTHPANIFDPGHAHGIQPSAAQNNNNAAQSGAIVNAATAGAAVTQSAMTGIGVTNDSVGGNGAHNNMPPFLLGTWYMKLRRATA